MLNITSHNQFLFISLVVLQTRLQSFKVGMNCLSEQCCIYYGLQLMVIPTLSDKHVQSQLNLSQTESLSVTIAYFSFVVKVVQLLFLILYQRLDLKIQQSQAV